MAPLDHGVFPVGHLDSHNLSEKHAESSLATKRFQDQSALFTVKVDSNSEPFRVDVIVCKKEDPRQCQRVTVTRLLCLDESRGRKFHLTVAIEFA
jgi:hypothetical protein